MLAGIDPSASVSSASGTGAIKFGAVTITTGVGGSTGSNGSAGTVTASWKIYALIAVAAFVAWIFLKKK